AYANDVLPRAKGTASRLQQEADGYRQRVIASAEGDASRFRQVLTEYAKAPAVTRERIYIETMRQVLQSTSKIMMDYRGSGNLLYLPLDKLMGGAQAGAEAGAAPRAAPPEPTTEAGPRSRETLRNRERADR
ncbi:MAG: modulator of FtsH protease HflK, partial [Betaproteobacteria bacterium]|nr:modulator of FtsH protease HflK [Betaproteobacteria bacterium]